MRIAVVGAGAVGGYFGGRLAQSGNDLFFVARGRQLEALRRDGLRVDSPKGDFSLPAVRACATCSEIGAVDLVIVAVKAWQVPEVAVALGPLVGEHTTILPLQNGVEAEGQLTAIHGPHVVGGLARIISMLVAPGHIRHLGAEPYIALGEPDNRRTKRVESIAEALRGAGIRVEIPPDIRVAMWEKFLFICSVSGVGAVTRAPIGILRSRPETRALLEEAMQEIRTVGLARGIAIPSDAVQRTLAFIDSLPPDGSASMQRDIMEGRPSELESQSGAVVRLGRAVGVATPLNRFLYHALLPMEARARGDRGANGHPERTP